MVGLYVVERVVRSQVVWYRWKNAIELEVYLNRLLRYFLGECLAAEA